MEMLAISVQSLEPTGSSASLPRNRGNSTLSFRSKVGPEFMVFIEDAVNELLKDRRVLRSSYGFGFFIQNFMTRRQFENMQVSPDNLSLSYSLYLSISLSLSLLSPLSSPLLSLSLSLFVEVTCTSCCGDIFPVLPALLSHHACSIGWMWCSQRLVN